MRSGAASMKDRSAIAGTAREAMGHEESPVGSQPVEQDVTETFAGHTASGAAVHQRSVVLADH